MYLSDLVIPLGIATYSLLLIMLATGIFRKKLKKKFIKIHKVFSIITFIVATIHAGISIYIYFFSNVFLF